MEENDGKQTTRRSRFAIPWKLIGPAAVPIALLVYYLAWVAPELVPVPPGVNVPFPAATRILEEVSMWTGNHRGEVALIGLGLLASGLVTRFLFPVRRYYITLTVLVTLTLGFAYLSISAPIDRLLHAVEKSIPKDHRVPDHRSPSSE